MKKQLIYAGMFLLTAGLTACNEDFKDWADPQSNPQEDPAAQVTATFTAGKDANIIMDDVTTDSVEIAQLASTTAEEGSEILFKSLSLNDDYTLPFVEEDGIIKVALVQLDSVTQEAYKSRASVERELKITVNASATTPKGDGIALAGNDVTIKLKPISTPATDPDGYYVVGTFTGWNGDEALKMIRDSKNENIYILETATTATNQSFKFFPAAAINGNEINWAQALGSLKDGDPTSENFIYWKNGEKEPGAIMVEAEGKIKIILDVTNFRYSVKDNSAPAEMYMTGSAYNWGDKWNPLTPVNDTKGSFWGIYYFSEDEEVKFAPQADWGNDFGFTSTISQESIALAELSDSGGNLKVGKAGWYLIYVSVIGDAKAVDFYTPNIYLTGDTSYNGWDSIATEEDLFTVPETADGEFVSPAFLKDGEVRICVHPKNDIDWWRTEFIILNGKITYRGNGGDQNRVQGKTGQKAYLKFSDNTGRIE